MILLQAMLVSTIGFGLGIGGATWFGNIRHGARLAAGVLHAVGSVYRHGCGGRRDQHFVELAEHAARDGRRTGRGVPRVMAMNGDKHTTVDRLPKRRQNVRQRQCRGARAARRRSGRLPGRDHDARGPERLRQDDAAVGRRRHSAADERQRRRARHRADEVELVAADGVSPRKTSASCFSSSICCRR